MSIKTEILLLCIVLLINTSYIIYFCKKFEQIDKDINCIVDFINKEIKDRKK